VKIREGRRDSSNIVAEEAEACVAFLTKPASEITRGMVVI
jgi:hypothetical protein